MASRTVSAQRIVRKRGLTYQEVADELGYGLSTVKNTLAGITRPSRSFLERLGGLLGVDPDALTFGDDVYRRVRTTAVRGPR